MISTRSRLVLATAATSLALLACGDDDGDDDTNAVEDAAQDVRDAIDDTADDAVEALARTIAAQQGEDEFEANGIDVDDELTCEAEVTDARSAVQVSCTGTSEDGRALAIEGTTSEIPGASVTELEGEFVGTADGEEVFAVDTLGG